MTIDKILKKYGHLIKGWDSEDYYGDGTILYYLYLKKPYVSDCEGYAHDMISGYVDELENWLKSVWKIDPAEWDKL